MSDHKCIFVIIWLILSEISLVFWWDIYALKLGLVLTDVLSVLCFCFPFKNMRNFDYLEKDILIINGYLHSLVCSRTATGWALIRWYDIFLKKWVANVCAYVHIKIFIYLRTHVHLSFLFSSFEITQWNEYM